MTRSILTGSVAACLCVGLAMPLLAAEPAAPGAVNSSSADAKNVSATKPAEKCLSDLRTFDNQITATAATRDRFHLSAELSLKIRTQILC